MRALDFVKQSPQKIHRYLREYLNRKEYNQWWEVGSTRDIPTKFCNRLDLHGFTIGREDDGKCVMKKLPVIYLNRYQIIVEYKSRVIWIDFNYCGGGEWVMIIKVEGQVE